MPDRHTAQTPPPVFSRRLSVDDVRAHKGVVEATADECAQLASLCRVERLGSLRFAYELQPLASHRFHLTGELRAEVTQACIVTLEPVEEHIREAVDIEFWPEHQLDAASRDENAAATFEASEPPEPISAGRIDVGVLAAEILASALNPYPRKADAEFVWQETPDEAETAKSGPFAGLAKLQRKG